MDWLTKHFNFSLRRIASDPASILSGLRDHLASAAMTVYESWEQDEDGIDPMLGGGGICDEIAKEIGNILARNGFDIGDGGQDDHAWVVAVMDGRAFSVDIPCRLYETGAWYSWTKKKNVQLTGKDVEIHEIPYEDVAEIFNSDNYN
jgi:hypothetical protein